MRRRLVVLTVLVAALSLSLANSASAAVQNKCFEENYGGGTCATTCVWYNNQGSVEGWDISYHGC